MSGILKKVFFSTNLRYQHGVEKQLLAKTSPKHALEDFRCHLDAANQILGYFGGTAFAGKLPQNGAKFQNGIKSDVAASAYVYMYP